MVLAIGSLLANHIEPIVLEVPYPCDRSDEDGYVREGASTTQAFSNYLLLLKAPLICEICEQHHPTIVYRLMEATLQIRYL